MSDVDLQNFSVSMYKSDSLYTYKKIDELLGWGNELLYHGDKIPGLDFLFNRLNKDGEHAIRHYIPERYIAELEQYIEKNLPHIPLDCQQACFLAYYMLAHYKGHVNRDNRRVTLSGSLTEIASTKIGTTVFKLAGIESVFQLPSVGGLIARSLVLQLEDDRVYINIQFLNCGVKRHGLLVFNGVVPDQNLGDLPCEVPVDDFSVTVADCDATLEVRPITEPELPIQNPVFDNIVNLNTLGIAISAQFMTEATCVHQVAFKRNEDNVKVYVVLGRE